jgi:hypothetical protein
MRSFRAASARACNKSRIAGWLLIAIMSLSAALADEAPGLLEDPVVGSFAAGTVSRLPMRFPTALLASPR